MCTKRANKRYNKLTKVCTCFQYFLSTSEILYGLVSKVHEALMTKILKMRAASRLRTLMLGCNGSDTCLQNYLRVTLVTISQETPILDGQLLCFRLEQC